MKNKSLSDQKNQMTKNKTLKDSMKIQQIQLWFFQIKHQPAIIFFFDTGKTSYQSNQNKSSSPTPNQPKIKGSNWKTRESSDKKKKTNEKKIEVDHCWFFFPFSSLFL